MAYQSARPSSPLPQNPSRINGLETSIPRARWRVFSRLLALALGLLLWAGPVAAQTCTDTSPALADDYRGYPPEQRVGLVKDCNTLLNLRDTLRGTATAALNWDVNTRIAHWRGVVVRGSPPRVTKLHLISQHHVTPPLNGTIPAAFANLDALTLLDLARNDLIGPIPDLGGLTKLTHLNLGSNSLTGSIPPWIGDLTELTQLFLSGNDLSGSIPPGINNLTKLTRLGLGGSGLSGGLTGSIPTISALTELTHLGIGSTGLTGPIPDVSTLTKLVHLNLGYNSLSGSVPDVSALTKLRTLSLPFNALSGALPNVSALTPSLTTLVLSYNALSGSIPNNWRGLTKLEHLDLEGNALTGPIPDLRSLTKLEQFWVRFNNLCLPPASPVLAMWVEERKHYSFERFTKCEAGTTPNAPQFGELIYDQTYIRGQSLSRTLPEAGGGTTPLTYSLSPSSPDGLTFNSATRILEGTPTTEQPATDYTYTVTDSANPALQDGLQFRITVTDSPPPVTDTAPTVSDTRAFTTHEAMVGLPFHLPLPAVDLGSGNGGPYGYVLWWVGQGRQFNNGIDGLTFNPTTRELSGTPTTSGDYPLNYVVHDDDANTDATDAFRHKSTAFTLTVSPNPCHDDMSWYPTGVTTPAPALVRDCNILLAAKATLQGTGALNWDAALSMDMWDGVTVIDGRLELIQLDKRPLGGTIPPELGDLSHLTDLVLRNLGLTGPIPPELGDLTTLRTLSLRNDPFAPDIHPNQLTGPIPPELGNLTTLWKLQLDRNQLTGPIPPALGSLSELTSFLLDRNRLTGTIPAALGALTKVGFFDVSHNQLTGTIPAALGTVGSSATPFTAFHLNHNQLTGRIPHALTNLKVGGGGLKLHDNQLTTPATLTVSPTSMRENAGVTTFTATVTVTDPVMQFASRFLAADAQAATMQVTATARGGVPVAISPLGGVVNFALDNPYDATTMTYTHVTSASDTFLLTPTDDTRDTSNGTVTFSLTGTGAPGVAGTVLEAPPVTITIIDNDESGGGGGGGGGGGSGGGGGGGGEPTPRGDVRGFFERPAANSLVSGVDLVQGWAFAEARRVEITSVTLDLRGPERLRLTIPCCSARADVEEAHPQFPRSNTRNSGWGLTINWGNLEAGTYRATVRAHARNGQSWRSPPRTITVIKPGDIAFMDQFSLAEAEAWIDGDRLVVDGVVVRDKVSGAEQTVQGQYAWQTGAQGLRLVETGPALEQARWFPGRTLLAWMPRLWAWLHPARATAQPGLELGFEAPPDMTVVSGIDLIRGWAVATDGSAVDQVTVGIGETALTAPCCSDRSDVAAAFPDADALESGWGLVFNWGNLPAGEQQVTVDVETTAGSAESRTHSVEVVRLGGFAFLDAFDLSEAEVAVEGEELVLSGVEVRDKASGTRAVITVRVAWSIGTQGLVVVDSE